MNPLIQFKKILILPLLIVLALVVGALTVVPAFATPPVGVTVELLATGPFDELDVSARTGRWKARIDTKGGIGRPSGAAKTLKLSGDGAVGFIDWLGGCGWLTD